MSVRVFGGRVLQATPSGTRIACIAHWHQWPRPKVYTFTLTMHGEYPWETE